MKILVIGLGEVGRSIEVIKSHISENQKNEIVVACIDTDFQKKEIDDSNLTNLFPERVTYINRTMLDDTTLTMLDKKDLHIQSVKEEKLFTGSNRTPKKKKRKR